MRRKNTPPPPAPEGLSERSTRLWTEITATRGMRSPGRLALLKEALHALDRADQARATVDREGFTTTTASSGTVHLHPCVKLERESRALFGRLWEQLRLAFDPQTDGQYE